ncbi:hypothetical protein EI77_02610 [Prosthecobacter fusiformis]|uniref:Uncharacterized protein n=1 Tax=Prosthecobacter fusiformis TaxID=48464 RepID=A0A4R7S094_9BACT|nr:hypothetical protein [Prosthecobacter fusiformis]TDU70565.1 hypothetical protein EI77_02610 [Prosthecobacter fusiformis]
MSEAPSNSSAQTIPTLEDWHSEPWDLDVAYAFGDFNGKTVEESVLLFEENAICYQEDLMWMPSRVFGYYLRAYIAYLLSHASTGDSDGASCFLGLIEHKLQLEPANVRPLWSEIRPVIEHLAANQQSFRASPEIYGSFQKRAETLFSMFAGNEPSPETPNPQGA